MKASRALVSLSCLMATLAFGDVPESADKAVPLETGNPVPSVEVRNLEGETVNLAAFTSGKPSVLIFYRGSWCPYCNRHLAALADIEGNLKEMGYQMMAISPDKPEGLKEAIDKNDLGYTLLSDSSADAIKAFGLAFEVGTATRLLYKGYGIDLEKASGEDHHILPVPAVYLSDASGIIRYKYTNPDYKTRLSPEDLLAAAKEYATSHAD